MPPKLRVVGANPFATEDDVVELARLKLESSGLTLEDAERLGIEWVTADQVKNLHQSHWHLPALKINYWKARKPDEPVRIGKNWPAYYRLRALREPVPKPEKFSKFIQEPDSGVAVFYPRCLDWAEIMDDWQQPIILTEGELKGAKACLEGFPTIGLGGVYSWKSSKMGISFLPDLAEVTWARRQTFIIFDSDASTNINVNRALYELAEELQRHGALPRVVMLPAENGLKTGLDDYLLARGKDALKDIMGRAQYLTACQSLWEINKTFAYIQNPGAVVRMPTAQIMKPDALGAHALTEIYYEGRLLQTGVVAQQQVNAGSAWVGWPLRSTAAKIVYSPGKDPRSLIEYEGEICYNLWCGWGCQPKAGPVKLFTKLIDHLFTGADPAAKRWFMAWLAYPLIHPGTKLLTSAVLWSIEQGVGKTLLGVSLRKIYGENYTEITQETLSGNFNEWAKARQMIVGDDVTGPAEKRRELDRLKTLITATHTRINEKNVPAYTVEDRANFLWTSNRADAFFLETHDRRFFIHEITVKPLETSFYDEYDDWLKSGEAGPAIFDYLLKVDVSGFNPNAKAFETVSKTNMIRLAKTDIDDWISSFLEYPDEFLKIGEMVLSSDFLTLKQLRAAYESYSGSVADVSQVGFARKLASLGVQLTNGGKPLYVPNTELARWYIVRRRDHWKKANMDSVKRYIGEQVAKSRMRGV